MAKGKDSYVVLLGQALPMFFGWWRRARREKVPLTEVLRREREELDTQLTDEEREMVRRVGQERRARREAKAANRRR
jgi:hypothetical protein